MLEDALNEMILAYQQQGKAIPLNDDDIIETLSEDGNHSIYTNKNITIPVKRHNTFDKVTANQIF